LYKSDGKAYYEISRSRYQVKYLWSVLLSLLLFHGCGNQDESVIKVDLNIKALQRALMP
jgi:hypothetical protein